MHRHGHDAQRGQELLALREGLPMRMSAAHLFQARARHAEQGVIDADHRLTDDAQQARVLEQVVGLVHRAGLGVLERHDAMVGFPLVTREKTRRTVSHGIGSASGNSERTARSL